MTIVLVHTTVVEKGGDRGYHTATTVIQRTWLIKDLVPGTVLEGGTECLDVGYGATS